MPICHAKQPRWSHHRKCVQNMIYNTSITKTTLLLVCHSVSAEPPSHLPVQL